MSVTFFTDRDLGKAFPRILREAGLAVEEHSAHFAHDTPDDEWLTAVGHRGWYVIGTRKRIERFIERHERRFIAKLYRPEPRELKRVPTSPGRVELWLEGDE